MLWILGVAIWLPAAPVRVTTWDFGNGVSNIAEAADALKKLGPDVILLQHVANWQTCHQLAQALQPAAYQVVTCSGWHDASGKNAGRQVAILSRTKAYLSWSEPWKNSDTVPAAPGGFAFAAFRLGGKNIGVFSLQLGDGAPSGIEDIVNAASPQALDEAAGQLSREISSLQNWKVNRLQAEMVAGNFDAANEKAFSRLEQIGFENVFAGSDTPNALFSRGAGLVTSPLVSPAVHFEHPYVTCELDVAAWTPPSTSSMAGRTELPPLKPQAKLTTATPPLIAPVHATAPAHHPQTMWWIVGILTGGLALVICLRKLTPSVRLAPPPSKNPTRKITPRPGQITITPLSEYPPYVQVEMEGSTQTRSQSWRAPMPAAVREGVVANLTRWLKQKMVQRLVADRTQLLATQQAAAVKMVAVDERLAKIEHQIQQRNQDYERRIDELLKALINAEEENRVLIRAQIELLKAEMANSRRKLEQHSDEREY
jgi:hypothetical protein